MERSIEETWRGSNKNQKETPCCSQLLWRFLTRVRMIPRAKQLLRGAWSSGHRTRALMHIAVIRSHQGKLGLLLLIPGGQGKLLLLLLVHVRQGKLMLLLLMHKRQGELLLFRAIRSTKQAPMAHVNRQSMRTSSFLHPITDCAQLPWTTRLYRNAHARLRVRAISLTASHTHQVKIAGSYTSFCRHKVMVIYL